MSWRHEIPSPCHDTQRDFSRESLSAGAMRGNTTSRLDQREDMVGLRRLRFHLLVGLCKSPHNSLASTATRCPTCRKVQSCLRVSDQQDEFDLRSCPCTKLCPRQCCHPRPTRTALSFLRAPHTPILIRSADGKDHQRRQTRLVGAC